MLFEFQEFAGKSSDDFKENWKFPKKNRQFEAAGVDDVFGHHALWKCRSLQLAVHLLYHCDI